MPTLYPSRTLLIITLVITTILIAVSFFPMGCSARLETITLAAVPTELNALVYVAQVQNFFADAGLTVILRDYDSGAAAMEGMLKGEADIALAAEFPITRQVFNKQDIINIGTIAKYENTFIVWHADSGINSIPDLKNKRIGVTLQTISEFYLGRTLEINNISIHDVTLVNTKAAEAIDALTNETADAVVTWEPWVHQIDQKLGDQAVITPAQNSQFAYWNIVTTSQWANSHGDTSRKLLKALDKSEKYVIENQDEAKAIIKEWMNFEEDFINAIWPRYQFSITLGQSLITAMEDEARWLIDNDLTTKKHMPNFSNYIDEKPLKGIKPEAVEIIR
jgi:NitT/TauT family transport system substrate-binding protein